METKNTNPVKFKGDICVITTNGNRKVEFIIDKDDYDKISEYCWHINGQDFIMAPARKLVTTKKGNKSKPKIYINRLITGADEGDVVYYKNKNRLDNRKSNLVKTTPGIRHAHKVGHRTYKGKPCTSKYKGVSYTDYGWRAQVCCDGITYRLGVFNNEIDAARAYNKKAFKLWGEHATLNKI